MRTLESLLKYDSALVFGIGGSGDIVGSIPTARFLESQGLDVVLGGVSWEPLSKDPTPGPRSLSEISAIEKISESVAMISSQSQTPEGIEFTETVVARNCNNPVVMIDITLGVDAIRKGIDQAVNRLGMDLVIGVDAGGDVLARGDEPGIRSPVTDGIGLVVLDEMDTPSCLGVFGYGSDGELSRNEIKKRFSVISRNNGTLGAWGLTIRVRKELEELLEHVETEASRVPVEAARGDFGQKQIRGGSVSVDLTPISSITFYFNPTIVAKKSLIASQVRDSSGLDDAAIALGRIGLESEFVRERRAVEESS